MMNKTGVGPEFLHLPITEVSVIIPCKNEEDAIEITIDGVKKALDDTHFQYEIIVVDDGSTDLTRQRAIAAGARVLVHEINMGYGNSIMDGIKVSKYSVIAILDADGTYDPADLPRMVNFLSRHDMVVGQRKWTPDNTTLTGKMFRKALFYTILYLSGVKAPDFNSGFRVFRKCNIMDYRPVLCPTFSFTTTLTVLFLQSAHSVCFVPIEYSKRIGRSKVNYVKDAIRTFNYVFSITSILRPYRIAMAFVAVAALLNGLVMILSLFSSVIASIQVGLYVVISVPILIATFFANTYVNSRIFHLKLKRENGENL